MRNNTVNLDRSHRPKQLVRVSR